ncbi:MAG: cyanophycin synthetase [Luteibaculaceae bacterium]|jgi:cyanophycin synthetase
MKILDLRVMRGPNYWSVRRHKLIVMRLDLEEMEELPTNKVDGFNDRIKAMFPTMQTHRCSKKYEGGFFERLDEGTWMGHVIEHVALEIQTLAGMDCGFGRTRGTGEYGVYHVVFSYMEDKAGVYAAKSAVRIVEALIANAEYDLEADIQEMREIRDDERLGPSTGSIVDEAVSRGIPYIRLNKHSLVQLGYGLNQRRIQATVAGTTSNIGVEVACDKEETKHLLENMGVPVASGDVIYDEEDLDRVINRIGYPLVIKPLNGNHGKRVSININSREEAVVALHVAKERSRYVIVERFVEGLDHRLLVINHKFVAAAKRTPAMVVGDGKSNIEELVALVNADPRRGYGHEKELTTIKVDDETLDILKKQDLTLESVLDSGTELYLKRTANLSTGGTATDVTDMVHPYNVFMAERISRIVDLDICGIDVMTTNISESLVDTGGVVIEVNAGPGFRMHISPTEGLPRNIAEPVVDMLFPPGSTSRIPIVAITGTNGKTTTSRLIAHIMKTQGYKVGFTTTDGIYIQNRLLQEGDCTGPASAEFVLRDPTVNFAVLECARGGMLRAGLGFTSCDVGVVTNVAGDHLGLRDINNLDDMARVKGIVAESVSPDGYAVLNADDDLVYNMRKTVSSNVALFSMEDNNPRIKAHCAKGGLAAIVENGFVTICKGEWKIRVDKVVNIPLTFSGKAAFMTKNVLAAVLAAFVQKVKIEDIKVALETFIPSPVQTPGRMNLFRFKKFNVLVDYAHNPAGFRGMAAYLEKTEATKKVGIIAGVGDRRDSDTIELGELAAGMFDEVIIRQDKHLRGQTEEAIMNLLREGILNIDPNKKVTCITKESEAITHAITTAVDGSLIVVCSDVVPAALNVIMKFKEEEDLRELNPANVLA